MTTAILGTGGVGGMLAARLAVAGADVVCVGSERAVTAIRGGGLRLEAQDGTLETGPRAIERLDEPVELLVVAVKAFSLDSALDRLDWDLLHGAVVLPLLNGLEHLERIRARLQTRESDSLLQAPPVVVAGSIGRLEVFSPEPGRIVQRTPGALVMAASHELTRETLTRSLAPLHVPTVDVVIEGDERAVLWDKAARLAVLAAITTASGMSVGGLREDTGWRSRLEAALGEACAVATADGAPLQVADQWAIVEGLPAELTTSAARDAEAGRATELDAITGSVVRAARRLGVPSPVLDGLLAEASARP